ncbi:glycosyl transferase family 9 [Solidesulfovibrio carbinoliphilus subsp. oakridgensis]|uniref:Glycosyl transferase family 9 n=1 Tax=Solidesulfovibrio carbinoliphilus subsp. oakridgensis TaxID=694327 RepID=G7QBX2_9BACT|nr:glycosyltransferase family 9 protein [Solidesulfovibrio carbinoliphilus]EHJ49465.1 glycosyl transferase family 9 [Solidesulfovibrio carbinoliphilus subsp. oakridgensis]
MARFLVLQLARLGDLLQTRRLLLGLSAKAARTGGEVHLAVDTSLAPLAGRLYPFAVVHGLPAHGLPGLAKDAAASRVLASRRVFETFAALSFDRVFCLNFSPLGMAMAALFPPEAQRGYRQTAGQTDKDPLLRLVFRLARDRRGGGINLADIWAHLDDDPLPPEAVNPVAAPRGGGLGVALAGRTARRSLPPEILAPLVRMLFHATGGKSVTLYGTREQASEARALLRRLDPGVREACRDLTGQTDLFGLADSLSGLDRLVTPDTGAMHLAAFCGVPVTAFFLSSAWCHETGPYGVGHRVFQAVTPCAPCLESAPCGEGLACLPPFGDPALVRALSGAAKAGPPAGIVGFATDCDTLGMVCRPVCGQDPTEAARAAFRAFLTRRLAGRRADALDPDLGRRLAEAQYLETDWILPPPGRPLEGEW